METMKDYDLLGVKVDVVYFMTIGPNTKYPTVKDIFLCDNRITHLLDHNLMNRVESAIYDKLKEAI